LQASVMKGALPAWLELRRRNAMHAGDVYAPSYPLSLLTPAMLYVKSIRFLLNVCSVVHCSALSDLLGLFFAWSGRHSRPDYCAS
jgi:hypothetical protein